MDLCPIPDNYKPLLKQHWPPILLGLAGLIFLGYGLIAFLGSSDSSNGVVFEPQQASGSAVSNQDGNIVVDVEGAVVKPGVYHLPFDSRIWDALVASGGLSANADRNWVARSLNLALKLKDGSKIYIPQEGDNQSVATNISGDSVDHQININTASQQGLESLAGIGPVTAQKIIDGRPYNVIEDLLTKKIVSEKVFEKIKERITTY